MCDTEISNCILINLIFYADAFAIRPRKTPERIHPSLGVKFSILFSTTADESLFRSHLMILLFEFISVILNFLELFLLS